MKRSQSVNLLFLGTLGIAVAACGFPGRGGKEQSLHCVNKDKIVVEEKYCPDKGTTGSNGGSNFAIFPYYWWYGGGHYNVGQSVIGGGGSISPNPGTTYRSSTGSALTGGGSKAAPSAGGVSRGGFGGSAGSGGGGE